MGATRPQPRAESGATSPPGSEALLARAPLQRGARAGGRAAPRTAPALRPGIVRGATPERADVRPPAIARAVRTAAAAVAAPRRIGRGQVRAAKADADHNR